MGTDGKVDAMKNGSHGNSTCDFIYKYILHALMVDKGDRKGKIRKNIDKGW